MALRRAVSKRLLCPTTPLSPFPLRTIQHSPPTIQLRPLNNSALPSSFLSLPLGNYMIRDKFQSMNIAGHQLPRFDAPEDLRVSEADAKRIMTLVQLELVRERLRNIPVSTVPYSEFVEICVDACGSREMGAESAKALDESGNVIVLGGVVFLHPHQVAKSMETLIRQSIGMPNDPRRAELEKLEREKWLIDEKARSQVRRELWWGLGFLMAQTVGFMRLTFWELTWDVMEPICFFTASLHFALAYAFFLRTSKEPSFEAYFQRRFKVKQNKLIKTLNFDMNRYNHLCRAFYPSNRLYILEST